MCCLFHKCLDLNFFLVDNKEGNRNHTDEGLKLFLETGILCLHSLNILFFLPIQLRSVQFISRLKKIKPHGLMVCQF